MPSRRWATSSPSCGGSWVAETILDWLERAGRHPTVASAFSTGTSGRPGSGGPRSASGRSPWREACARSGSSAATGWPWSFRPASSSSRRSSASCSPARCRCRSIRRCGSAGSSEYLRRTAGMLELTGARAGAGRPAGAAHPRRGGRSGAAGPRLPRPGRAAAASSRADRRRASRSRPGPVLLRHHGRSRSRSRSATGPSRPRSRSSTALAGHRQLRHSCVSWLPLYHDMGLIGCVFPALSRDADADADRARSSSWPGRRAGCAAISRYRATISPAPNFAYDLCVKRIARRRARTGSICPAGGWP